jgi:hypothetical protein
MIKNWRPISLLSCFYKIWSKAVDARLEKIIDKVTSLSQKAYNKKDTYRNPLLIQLIQFAIANTMVSVAQFYQEIKKKLLIVCIMDTCAKCIVFSDSDLSLLSYSKP